MRLEVRNLLRGEIVVDAQLEVIRACNQPVLSRYEPASSDGHVRELERLHDRAGFVTPNVYMARVQRCENPWLGRMEVDSLDPL